MNKMRQRKQMRLRKYDYAGEGVYFVTVCVKDRQCVFGDIVDGQMKKNVHGQIIDEIWNELPNQYKNIALDDYVIMPDHFHGIIIVGAGSPGPLMEHNGPLMMPSNSIIKGGETPPLRQTLSNIMGYYKYETTKRINGVLNTLGMKLWQRSFHDRIIRNEQELNAIREYIQRNPNNGNLINKIS